MKWQVLPKMEISQPLWACSSVLSHSCCEDFFLTSNLFFPCCIRGCGPLPFHCAPLRRGSFFSTTHCSGRLQFLSCLSLVVSSLGYTKKFLLRWPMLQPLSNLSVPLLDSFQFVSVLLAPQGPRLDTVFQAWPCQCRVEANKHFLLSAGCELAYVA